MKANGVNGGGIAQLMNAMLGANGPEAGKPAGPDFESLLQQAGSNQQQPEADATTGQSGNGQASGQGKPEAADGVKPTDGKRGTAGFGGSFGDSAAPGYAECAAGGSGCG